MSETHDYKGLTIEIHNDHNPQNPRKEWDNLGTFAFFHRDFTNESDLNPGDYNSFTEMQEYIEKTMKAICVPVYIYDHSGQTIATTPFSCPLDSGQLGFAFITREKVREEYGWKRITQKRLEQIEGYLTGEVETYDQYIRGDVFGYVIKDGEGEELDSHGEFYGDEYCLKEAKRSADYYANIKEEKANVLAYAI